MSDAEKTLQERREEHEETSTEIKKLVRIRHVHGAIRQRRELTQKIATLGDVIVLAEDAIEQLGQAEQQEAKIRAQVDILAPQLEEARQALEGITFDEGCCQLNEGRSQLNVWTERLKQQRSRSATCSSRHRGIGALSCE